MNRWGLVLLLIMAAGYMVSASWNAAFEAVPASTDSLATWDDVTQDFKTETRSRNEIEMCFGPNNTGEANGCADVGSNTGVDNGRMREGSARAFMDNAQPANLLVSDYDAPAGAGGVATLDDGRLWIDTNDSNRLYAYEDQIDTQWEGVTVGALTTASTSDDEILAGAYNLVYNGSFEVPGLDGDVTNTCAPCAVLDPEIPPGWELILTPTIAYADSTDIDYIGDGFEVRVTGVGAVFEGIQQTLPRLAGNQFYKVIARVKDDGNICRMEVTGNTGDGFPSAVTLGGAAWTTLDGIFGTNAVEDVVIELYTNTDTAVCVWDHVAVYRIDDTATDRDEVSDIGALVFEDTSTATTSCGNDDWTTCGDLVAIEVTPPGPGYLAMIHGTVFLENFDGATECTARIEESVGSTAVAYSQFMGFTTGNNGEITMQMNHVTTTPLTTGVTVTYDIDLRQAKGAGTCDLTGDFADGTAGNSVVIQALLIPTR